MKAPTRPIALLQPATANNPIEPNMRPATRKRAETAQRAQNDLKEKPCQAVVEPPSLQSVGETGGVQTFQRLGERACAFERSPGQNPTGDEGIGEQAVQEDRPVRRASSSEVGS